MTMFCYNCAEKYTKPGGWFSSHRVCECGGETINVASLKDANEYGYKKPEARGYGDNENQY